MGRSLVTVTLVAALSVVGAACGSSRQAGGAAPGKSVRHIECDRAVDYLTLGQLRRASTSVAVIRPTGRSVVRTIGGVPSTLSTVTVVEQLRGTRLPAMFVVRQTGVPGVILDGCQALVSKGHVYIAYLSRFRLRHGGPGVRGQYEAAGLYRHEGQTVSSDRSDRAFSDVTAEAAGSPSGGSLPARISIADARTG